MARLLLFFLLVVSVNSFGQDSVSSVSRHPTLLKWNPLSLFDTESMMQIGVERFLTARTSLQAELGYGPPFLDKISLFKEGKIDNRQAWRIRAEYRLYREPDLQAGRYLAIEGFAMTVNGTASVYQDIVSGGNNTTLSFPIHKRIVGGHLKFGIQQTMGRKSNTKGRWLYDFYGGLGLRYNQTVAESVDGITYTHSIGGMFFDVYRPTHKLAPSAVVGIKIAYLLL